MTKPHAALQNKTTHFLSSNRNTLQRKCACGNHVASGECTACVAKKNSLQRTLSIGSSNDPLEQEADRIADHVMAMPAISNNRGATAPNIQRFTPQSTAVGQQDLAPVSVDHALASTGRPLEPVVRHDMEQRLGRDFSGVRVYTNATAEQSARDINANAYTVGHKIVFGTAQYAPNTQTGQRLLAHELTHVVQQNNLAGTATESKQTLRRSVGGFFRNIGRAIVDFFTGSEPDYDDETLTSYLDQLKKTNSIEGDFDSDNKARAIVRKQFKFKLQMGTQIKVLLVEEMLDGPTLGDDEKSIIGLLRTSPRDESGQIVAKIGRARLWDNFSGRNRRVIEAITVTEADFLDASYLERLKNLSEKKLEEFRDNARDPAVKAGITKVLQMKKITTPLDIASNFNAAGEASFEVGGADVIVKPDETSTDRAMGENAHTTIGAQVGEITNVMRNTNTDTIVSFDAAKTSVTIQTIYGPEAVQSGPSGYGRGTTQADTSAGNTSIRFHESRHGRDILNFLRDNPPPQFEGQVGMSVADFDTERENYADKITEYSREVLKFSVRQSDCPGIPIPASGLEQLDLPATFCTDPARP